MKLTCILIFPDTELLTGLYIESASFLYWIRSLGKF